MNENIKKEIEKMSDNKEPIIVITNKETAVCGNELEIMNLITFLINNLINDGYPKKLIKGAFTSGMMTEEEAKKVCKEFEKSKDLSELSEKIKKIMGE